MAVTKRQMLFVPEINPESFVFFFEKGGSGWSWSIRDYSIPGRVRTIRPTDIQESADYFFRKARYAFNAPAHDTNDVAFWNKHTRDLNQRYGLADSSQQPAMNRSAASPITSEYPAIALEKLMESPKGRKTQDMDRILNSAASEDWASWNFIQLLLLERPTTWWREMLDVAHRHNADIQLPDALPNSNPVLWRLAASPKTYQEDSRRRMLNSRNPNWVAKAASSEPVEGPSEIDITIESPDMVIFIEAKLGSDISMNTTYDPHRNQIARNIDCLLERAESKDAAFWMLVKDEDPSRAYVQLMNAYKSDAGLLARDLPHRSAEDLERICQNLTILRWSDFESIVCANCNDPYVEAVKDELRRRLMPDAGQSGIVEAA
ncbi:MAG TPA: hypothetical protein VKR52_00365 [Terracidiphilus sp.]|nr:hypothetical protein [Terracidiphilus sp.]